MACCVRNIRTKNYQNLIIGFKVTVKNVRDVFLDTVYNGAYILIYVLYENKFRFVHL